MNNPKYIKLSDRGLVKVSGENCADFLQGIITNDINKLSDNNPIIYSLILTPQGKFLFDFFVIKQGENLILDCAASRTDDLINRLDMYKLRSKIEIKNISDKYDILAVIGGSPDSIPEAMCDPRHSDMPLRMIVEEGKLADNLHEVPLTIYDKTRISLCIPEGEKDMISEQSFPLQYNMDELNAISFDKGCYVGQEVTARSKHRGAVRKKIFRAQTVQSDDKFPSSGTDIKIDDKTIGKTRSGIGSQGVVLLEIDAISQAENKNFSIRAGNCELKILY